MSIVKFTLLTALALLLVGCSGAGQMSKAGSSEPSSTTPTVTVTAEPEPEPEPEPVVEPEPEPEPEPADPRGDLSPEMIDTAFTALVRSTYPRAYGPVDDATLIGLAKSICDAFDNGTTFAEAVTLMVDGGYTYDQAGGFIGAGVVAYCPEHQDLY